MRIRAFFLVTTVTLIVGAFLAAVAFVGFAFVNSAGAGITKPPGKSLSFFPSSDSPDVDDGYIAPGESVSPFADDLPAISKLDANLRNAVRNAARDARAAGVVFVITSGWRSGPYQQFLFDSAVAEHGSVAEARRVVAEPGTSDHETGNAVDIGYTDADSWMSQHGNDYGLCQKYTNEMWHFELLTTPGGECPVQLTDAES